MSTEPPRLQDIPAEQRARLVALVEAGVRQASQSLGLFLGASEGSATLSVAHPATLADLRTEGDAEAPLLVVSFELSGPAPGLLLLQTHGPDAARVAGRLLRREALSPEEALVDEKALGALSEAGNIVASSFLNELATALGAVCMPSVPHVHQGPGRLVYDTLANTHAAALSAGAAEGLQVAVEFPLGAPASLRILWVPLPGGLPALTAPQASASA